MDGWVCSRRIEHKRPPSIPRGTGARRVAAVSVQGSAPEAKRMMRLGLRSCSVGTAVHGRAPLPRTGTRFERDTDHFNLVCIAILLGATGQKSYCTRVQKWRLSVQKALMLVRVDSWSWDT
ncbi:hypothetical protein EJB05_20774, partial [Eragrostis curvula]